MIAIPETSIAAAARRTRVMIDQEEARTQLENALAPRHEAFQLVFLRAEGGMGKTRLLEEILKDHLPGRSAHSSGDGAAGRGEPVISDLVDVIDTRLHDSYRFVTELRRSLRAYGNKLDFGRFDVAEDHVKLLTASGAQLESIDRAQRAAAEAFIDDLVAIVQRRRVVLLIDTVERLSYEGSEWLLQEGLLLPDDLTVRTHHWLQHFIAEPRLKNVTLVLSGRGREGEGFFARVMATRAECATEKKSRKKRVELEDIHLKRFSLNQTRQYFAQLAEDCREDNPALAREFARAADPQRDHYKVIGLYTHGMPVRLALYAQVLAVSRGRNVLAAFRLSFEEACARAKVDPATIGLDAEVPDKATPELQRIQWDVEEEFLNLLFDDPNDRDAKVLRALVRAPRGLTAEQLHFILDAPKDKGVAEWRKATATSPQLRELADKCRQIEASYLGKRRSSLESFQLPDEEPVEDWRTIRIGLQDEVYRIYAEHTGLLAEPVSAETASIRAGLSAAERQRYQMNREDERLARVELYRYLAEFADAEHTRYLRAKQAYLQADEHRFEERFRLEDSNTYQFPKLPERQQEERRLLHTALAFFEIERMVYQLLQDPEHNLNSEYITLEDDNARAAQQEEDFWAQAEMWRAVHDDWLMKFVDLSNRQAAERRGETPVRVLRRFAEQENVARWLKRLVLRSSAGREIGEKNREIDFAERAEAYINNRPRGRADGSEEERQQYNDWGSWNHTLARAERLIWTQVAYIRRGKQVEKAIKGIAEEIDKLERLYTSNVNQKVIDNEGHAENGFAAVPATATTPAAPAHPAYARLGRLLSHAYNHLGYGQRTLGNMHEAVVYYGRALEYVRPERNKLQAHRATVLNNLSRALSELGWNGIGVCHDGRLLRWEVAEEVPLASSYNTLALIYDDMGRYEDAPLLSAKAIAYCRRARESRQLGLSLRQMAESLRHLAERPRTGQRTGIPADTYFDIAEGLLREARGIFEGLNQAERLVEVHLETGSLYRDRLNPQLSQEATARQKQARDDAYDKAMESLEVAEQKARECHVAQHVLDARINLARVYYYYGETDNALRVLDAIEADKTYRKHVIKPRYIPDTDDDALRNRNWVFRHLATAQWFRGWIALDRFRARVDYFKHKYESDDIATWQARAGAVKADPEAQGALRDAAKAYALGIAYAQLHSPRSRFIGTMQNDLYDHLRASNRIELDSFSGYLDEIDRAYGEGRLESVPFLRRFLREFFGLPAQSLQAAPAE